MNGYVYILKSLKNNRFYIGSTINIKNRLQEHNSGNSVYTSFSLPFELVFKQEFETIKVARQIEYKLKQLKNREIIESIINKQKLYINKKGNINW